MTDVASQIARTLVAIDEDAPIFRAYCAELFALAAACPERLLDEPELPRLCLELRKLRPHPLWAYGRVAPTLALKERLHLDGIICPFDSLDALPKPWGRECWLELPAERAEAELASLPMGWGLVLRGILEDLPIAELRLRSRLRPFGAHLLQAPGPRKPGPSGLELAFLARAEGQADAPRALPDPRGASLPELSPRVLSWAPSARLGSDVGRPEAGGYLCETSQALLWVLRLATRSFAPTCAL